MKKYFNYLGNPVRATASILLRNQGIANIVGVFVLFFVLAFILAVFV